MEPIIVVHGGACSSEPGDLNCLSLHAVKKAAKIGHRLLSDGASCVDAIVETLSILEDNPILNAGRGSFLNIEGKIQMHSMVMDGKNLETGGAVSVKNVKNPVKAARLIMEKSKHCILQGGSVSTFAKQHGLEIMPDEFFVTEERKKDLETFLDSGKANDELINVDRNHDTIGAVALDKYGNLACATSTGGITGQMKGRVGDSPIPGCGGFADNESVAVAVTGNGEALMKTCMARLIAFHVEQGETPQASAEASIDYMKARVRGRGGAIAVDKQGRVGIYCNTERMSWAVIGAGLENQEYNKDTVTYGIHPSVILEENL